MEKCDYEEKIYLLGFFASSVLFIASEIIGSSKCDATGVFSFCINGFCVSVKQCEDCGEISGDDEPLLN